MSAKLNFEKRQLEKLLKKVENYPDDELVKLIHSVSGAAIHAIQHASYYNNPEQFRNHVIQKIKKKIDSINIELEHPEFEQIKNLL